LPDGVEGELRLRGPSVTAGYFQAPEATAETFRDGWLHTGDLGYVLDGEVYVTGRSKDLIILNGRNVHPQAIEWAVAELEGVRRGNVVAFSIPGEATEQVVVVVERRPNAPEDLDVRVREAVQRQLGTSPADVVIIPAGTLPKTSSGKLQRRKTRQHYLDGSLGQLADRATASGGSSTRVVARHVARSLWTRVRSTFE